ncbi:MAG: hypothetical protein WCY47_08110 [Pusillimonas sp.]
MESLVALSDVRADVLHDVFDCRPETLLALADRVDQSVEDIQLVYREAEMDELWRAVSINVMELQHTRAAPEKLAFWLEIKDEVMRIHDIVGIDLDNTLAALALRQLASRVSAT